MRGATLEELRPQFPTCRLTHTEPSSSPDPYIFPKRRFIRGSPFDTSESRICAEERDDTFGPTEVVSVAKCMLQGSIATLSGGFAIGHTVGKGVISNASGLSPHMPGDKMHSHLDRDCCFPFFKIRLRRCTCISWAITLLLAGSWYRPEVISRSVQLSGS